MLESVFLIEGVFCTNLISEEFVRENSSDDLDLFQIFNGDEYKNETVKLIRI